MTTRIADLPENAVNMPGLHPISNSIGNNTYTPMNIHPNPYGYDDPTTVTTGGITTAASRDNSIRGLDSTPIPNNGHEENRKEDISGLTPEQIDMIHNTPKHKVPSRDIHLSKSEYTHDEKIQANYIPPIPTSTTYERERDYIKDHENKNNQNTENKTKNQSQLFDQIYGVIHYPLMISMIYFIFQYPLLDNIILYRIDPFFKIYGSDQNLNFYGNVVKSLLFGLAYFVLFRTIDYISRFQYVRQ